MRIPLKMLAGYVVLILLSMSVGCDGVLGSTVREDKCGVCGGDNTSCHIISGIFTRRGLPYGYNKVATIPRGACMINVTEMYASRNYLALKLSSGAYVINGNWALGYSREYPAAGTIFHYSRPLPTSFAADKEHIIAKGPTNESIDVMLLKQRENLGIMYEYTIPMEKSPHQTTRHKISNVLPEVDNVPTPADQAAPSYSTRTFNPQLSEQYRASGRDYAAALGGQRTTYDADDTSRPVYRGLGETAASTANHRYDTERNYKPASPGGSVPLTSGRHETGYQLYNQATGHRLRHRGHHGSPGRVVEQEKPQYIPPPSSGFQYEALTGQQASRYTDSQLSARQTGYLPHQGQALPLQGTDTDYQAQTGRAQHVYDPRTGQYYQQPQAQRSPLNDQISLSFPRGRSGVGDYDSGADFSWRISGFTECSEECGGGTQTTIVVCVKGGTPAVVTDENCDNALKPKIQTVTCNTNPCQPRWIATNWTDCSTSCGRGTQTRDVICKQRVSPSIDVVVGNHLCRQSHDFRTVKTCNANNPCVKWRIGDWGKCSAACGRGQRSREVVCVNSEGKPIPENKCVTPKVTAVEICDMGSCAKTWFYTEWSPQCSQECGEGVFTRQTFCNAEPERCNSIHRPESTKQCINDMPCGGKWFTGPWLKCNATCGLGVRKRDTVCMKKLGRLMAVVGNENCETVDRPETEQPCPNLPPCRPAWYMTDWSECSRSCGTGLRTREVKCLRSDQQVSEECSIHTKPEIRQSCNTMPCPRHRTTSSRYSRGHREQERHNTGQPQLDTGCTDKFKNCRLVVQARLCSYGYYKSICCLSCTGHDETHET